MVREFLRHLSLELYRSRLTVTAYEADLNGFNDFLVKSGVPTGDAGFFIASAVTTADIREWMAYLSEKGNSPASIRRRVQSLRAYFRFLMKRGIVASNPAASLPLPKTGRHLPKIAGHAEMQEAIDTCVDPQESLVLEMLYGCGLRRSELLAITDTDINLHSAELRILGKGDKHRVIPLPVPLLQKITAWQIERNRRYPHLTEPRPLFASAKGRMSQSKLYRIVRGALQATGAEKKSPHTLRHSFATRLLNEGADINSVKDLLGHASLQATQIYTHVAFSELNREWSKAHPRAKKQDPHTR